MRNFLLPLSLKVFWHKESDTQSFYPDYSICPHLTTTTTRGTHRKASATSESQPSSSEARTQLTDFSQIPQILRARFRCTTSLTSPGHNSYLGFLFWHILPARAWTPALMLHLTNPCAERNVLSLSKPKGKIYKTKSLGHYITSAEMQSVYSTNQADWAVNRVKCKTFLFQVILFSIRMQFKYQNSPISTNTVYFYLTHR